MVVGPDVAALQKYHDNKKRKEEEERRKIEKMKQYIKAKPKEEPVAPVKEEVPKQLIQDESGRLRDDKGNIINLKVVIVRFY
jgi:hypothetical protein